MFITKILGQQCRLLSRQRGDHKAVNFLFQKKFTKFAFPPKPSSFMENLGIRANEQIE